MRQSHETDTSERFKYDVCGRPHSEKCRLANHKEVEHRDKRWICDTCGKSYKSAEALNVHMKVRHTNTAKYKSAIASDLKHNSPKPQFISYKPHIISHKSKCPMTSYF